METFFCDIYENIWVIMQHHLWCDHHVTFRCLTSYLLDLHKHVRGQAKDVGLRQQMLDFIVNKTLHLKGNSFKL
jgi:hypothetical protein